MKKRTIISVLLTIGAMVATYKLWHHAPVLIFISIMILSFLLSYKITDYVADFKTIKNNSRIDIIFLLIFFVLLCIPASNMEKDKKSLIENRYLAKKPIFISKHKLNLEYGKEFNSWFNDRFNARKYAIRANTALICMINSKNCTNGMVTFDKKHKLMYRENFWGMEPINEDKEDILKTYAGNLNRFQDYCKKNNIGLYFLIVPRQADYFDFDIPDKRKKSADPAEEIIKYLKTNTNQKIVYPTQQMAQANKETPVFFKTDHHWTKKGAYVGYSETIKTIQKDYPDIKLLDESKLEKYYNKKVSEWWDKELNNGQTFRHMRLPKFYAGRVLDTPYLYYKNPEFENLEKINSEFVVSPRDVYFKYQKAANKKILVIGDSFGCNLLEFMPFSFRETLYIYNNPRGLKIENYQPIIEKYKPDIVLVLFYTLNIPRFLDLYQNKYSKNIITG